MFLYSVVFAGAAWYGSAHGWKLPQDALLVAGALAVVVAVVVSYRKQDVEEATSRRDEERLRDERVNQYRKDQLERQRLEIERTSRDHNDQSEQFARGVEMLGSDRPNVRMAGAYALAAVADRWSDLRQTTINVLCGYLRLPYGPSNPDVEQEAQEREVRLAVISIMQEHLKNPEDESNWCSYRFDFKGAYFDGGDFSDSQFFGERVNFDLCTFEPATFPIWFERIRIGREGSKTDMSFYGAKLGIRERSGPVILFNNITISEGSQLRFTEAKVSDYAMVSITVVEGPDSSRIKGWGGAIGSG